MGQIKRILHTRYRVNDLQKTVAFYKDALGLEEVSRHRSSRGSELVFVKAPQSEELIELCYFPGSGPVQVQPDLTHLAFEVEDMDAFVKEIEAKGYKLSETPSRSSSGNVIAFIDAPEGYEVELIQYAKS
jgi:lactoylglutathione lyase